MCELTGQLVFHSHLFLSDLSREGGGVSWPWPTQHFTRASQLYNWLWNQSSLLMPKPHSQSEAEWGEVYRPILHHLVEFFLIQYLKIMSIGCELTLQLVMLLAFAF